MRCELAKARTKTVFARGNPDSPVMFIGEGPGQEEDRSGLPFVGPAGQLLDRMIAAMPFAGPFQLVARIDADRDAVTRNPGDLQGDADGSFEPGASGIEIVIDEVL